MSTTPSSRFNRSARPSEDEGVKPKIAEPVATHVHSSSQNLSTPQELIVLQERLQKVQRERMQREVELTAAQKVLQECEAAALKMGINSLEEMEAYVQKLQEQDAAELEKFEAQLDEEEQMLARVSQQLSDLERE